MKLSELTTNAAKAIYLWLLGQQQATPKQIEADLGLSRRHVTRAIAELAAGGFVIRLTFGVYCASGGAKYAFGGANCAAEGASAAGGAVENDNCAAEGAKSDAEGAVSAQRNIYKQNKTKERKEENFEEENSGTKSTSELSKFVAQIPAESWQSVRDEAARHFKERNISPDLVDRIAFAVGMKFPGASKVDYDEIISDAEERRASGKIQFRWVHVNNQIRKIYEKAGWEWTPCRSSREVWIDVQHETQRAKKTGAAVLNPVILRIEEIESERRELTRKRNFGQIGKVEFEERKSALDAEFLALKLKASGITSYRIAEPPTETPLSAAVEKSAKKRRAGG